MKENYLFEQKKAVNLSVIIDIITSRDNIMEIFREVRNYIKTIIPCDYVTVLFNNERARYFYVLPALNISQKSFRDEILIQYNETSITEILNARISINRSDLKLRGNLTPGDLKFLVNGVSSDLSVPIVYKNRVRVVLNLSSYKACAFSEYHQAIVEDIAALLSLALERIDFIDELRDLKYNAKLWRERYKKLLRNTNDAIAVISSDVELIYETNDAFNKLTGYTSDQLHGMKFIMLHPKMQHLMFSKITKETVNGKKSEFEDFLLTRSDGQQVPVKVQFIAPLTEEEPLLLAVYQDLSYKKQIQENSYKKLSQLSTLLHLGSELLTKSDLDLISNAIIDEIGIRHYAKYVVLHLVDELSSKLKMCCARIMPFDRNTPITRPLNIGLSEGPYKEVLAKGDIIKVDNIYNDAGAFKWLPVAKKLGYRSLICLPLAIRNKSFGVLSLFFENSQTFEKEYIFNLKNAANYFALVIDNYKFNQRLKNKQQQLAVINELTKLINSCLELEEVIRTSSIEIQKIIDFDYFLVTLFNDSIENYQTFAIVSGTFSKLLKPEIWKPFKEADLGWIKFTEREKKGNDKGNAEDVWANKLQSKINTLLLAKNKYVGTITAASLEPNKYNKEHEIFIKKIAGQMAIAIENAVLFAETNKRVNEFSTLAKLSNSLNTSLDTNQIVMKIAKTVSEVTNTKLCTVRFVNEERAVLEAVSTIPEAEQKGLTIKEVQEFIPQIVKNSSPFYIENFKLFQSERHLEIENQFPIGYNAYLGVPIISRDQVIAVISVYWKKAHSIEENEINLISTIANHAARVLENAWLYKETLKNSSELKKSNQELENFIYTISHDLKTPIVSIQGFTSIMLHDFQTVMNEDSFHYLKRIQSNANQMEKLIQDLLELSRIGRVVSPFEEVNAEEVISQITAELIYKIEQKRINLIVDEMLPVIYCDRKRILQLFSNLIDNAIKYMGENNSAPQIEIGCKDEVDNYLFYVKDNGIGITPEEQQLIFGLFKGDEQPEEDDNSTGIGLAIVKRIVEHHRGKVWVDSESGKGSTFFFTIAKKQT